MKFKLLWIFLTLFLSLLTANDTLTLSSGVPEKGYDNLAKSIQNILKNSDFNTTIITKNSSGSIENLKRIANGEADLAIVQSDTAFYAENGNYVFKDSPIDNLTSIITFYQEPLFIITNQTGINNINQLANFRINIGLRNSGVESTSQVLFKSIGLWDKLSKYHYKPDKSIQALLKNRVQAILLNYIDAPLKQKIKEKKLFIVPISKKFVDKLKKTFSYFSLYKYNLNDESTSTIAVTSLLVANKDIDENKIYQLTKLIDSNYKDLRFPKGFKKNKEHFLQNPIENWHQGTLKYLNEKNIKHSEKRHFDLYILYLFLAIVILIIITLLITMYILHHTDLFHRYRGSHTAIELLQKIYFKLSKYKYISLSIFIILLNIVSAVLIKYFEHNWALDNGTFNSFDNLSLIKTLWWFFIFGSSGYDNNIFPSSNGGEFIASLAPMLEFSSILALLSLLTYDKIIKHLTEANGMGVKRVKDHIILCGWNDNAHFIINNLLHKNIIHKRQVVILADMQYEEPIKKYAFDPMYVFYVKGEATVREDLLRANITEADIAIVISDNKLPEADAKNILKVLTIEKYCAELEEAGKRVGRSNIHTIAEITNPQNISIAEDAGVDQIISLGNIESKIFTQAVQNPGVAKFINEIVTYNEQNDIYSFAISSSSQLYNKTYDEILFILRKYKILLLSINVENKKSKAQTEEIMKKFNLKNPVITNPFNDSSSKYRTHENDLIIVLAQYEKIVVDALKKLGG